MRNNQALQLNDSDLSVPNQTWGILLISFLGLYLELLFIRWIGTEIRIFAYLQNTILMVCFLGLGLGMFTASKPIATTQSLIPMTIILLLLAVPATRLVLGGISEMLSVTGDFVIWSGITFNDPVAVVGSIIIGLLLTYALLVLMVDMFVPWGRILGRLMDAHPNPIWSYSVNILGSVLGTWAFVLLSFFYQPPFVWLLIAAGLAIFFVLWENNKGRKLNIILLFVIVVSSWFASQADNAIDVIWSPYQKLAISRNDGVWVGEYVVTVNNVGYQGLIDLSKENVAAHPDKYAPELAGLSQYDVPALLHPNPKSVLIVGAGTGNDAAGALRNGAQSVTAVEIDPAIITIGRNLHSEKPYSNPNVHVVNDDARSFFANTQEKFDVISFSLLDSHTTTAMTNARLDHYVYTVESLSQAKRLLNENGVIVLSFEAQKPYIADRIRLALTEVFDQEPLVFRMPYSSYGWGGVFFVSGDLNVVQQQLTSNERLAKYIKELQETYPLQFSNDTKTTTDDWPYIYLQSPKIPNLYLFLLLIMIILMARSIRKWNAEINLIVGKTGFWHFFFLGAAFLLLEVQNISKASVALGNTWLVNAVIITGVLGMALLANWIAYKFPKLPLTPVYFLLIGTCLGLFFVDLARFAFLPYALKAVVMGSLTSLPMLFSGIVFIRSFAVTDDKSNALGANLIGALIGALLQSITFVTGIKALLLVVAVFYIFAVLTRPASRRELPLTLV